MAQIKISADTTPIKKSLVELSREVSNLNRNNTKISLISEKDRKFFKGELSKELGNVKKKIQENKSELSKLVTEAQKVVKGSQEELKIRNQITAAYKTQAKLAKEATTLQGGIKGMGGPISGGMGGMLGKGGLLGLGIGTMAAGGYWALSKAAQGRNSYINSFSSRDRLSGLGLNSSYNGNSGELASAGLTTQDMLDRRVRASSILGKSAGSTDNILQQARFERAYGLESGALTNVSTSLRANFGGAGANEVQMKLQASLMANGIEEAIGPYLEAATSLLARINENGMTSTSQMIAVLGSLTAGSGRTVEQISRTFGDINSGVSGATGEASAFLQAAFGRAGIGSGTIGGTRLALQAGGIFGMDSKTMGGRYSPGLMKNLRSAGYFDNMQQRSGAILNQFRASGGLGAGQSISGITDVNQFVGLNSMANSIFGTSGAGGFEALQLLEQAQSTKMSGKDFQKQLDKIKQGKDPSLSRLDQINSTLSGQLNVLTLINENLTMALGENQGNLIGATTGASNLATGSMSKGSKYLIGSGSKSLKSTLKGIPEMNGSGGYYPGMLNKGNLENAINENTKALKQGKDRNIVNKNEINVKLNGRKVKERTY